MIERIIDRKHAVVAWLKGWRSSLELLLHRRDRLPKYTRRIDPVETIPLPRPAAGYELWHTGLGRPIREFGSLAEAVDFIERQVAGLDATVGAFMLEDWALDELYEPGQLGPTVARGRPALLALLMRASEGRR